MRTIHATNRKMLRRLRNPTPRVLKWLQERARKRQRQKKTRQR
jgi:hypothetical protein